MYMYTALSLSLRESLRHKKEYYCTRHGCRKIRLLATVTGIKSGTFLKVGGRSDLKKRITKLLTADGYPFFRYKRKSMFQLPNK